MFFTGISDQDDPFGQGEEVEANTFAVKPDKILHFFTLDDLKIHFEGFKILEVGDLADQVSHTLYGLKSYQIRYILVCINHSHLEAAQHSVHPTGGSRCVFRQLSGSRLVPAQRQSPRPAHPRVTLTVRRPTYQTRFSTT